ncbi:hypothetical protein JAAARDRAFT_197620 [Jaapia argillacea MUCL 33604]|uniref:Uncharacterized protein n=1 Tax=Jaapia argillacea MUCL 33604 TaxID=933084 RepID=A0A067PPA3_9AGAM|nr:hypothetical protein JAAARDRAFT_197620 [Jaapia argillacea MUCL 33604]
MGKDGGLVDGHGTANADVDFFLLVMVPLENTVLSVDQASLDEDFSYKLALAIFDVIVGHHLVVGGDIERGGHGDVDAGGEDDGQGVEDGLGDHTGMRGEAGGAV